LATLPSQEQFSQLEQKKCIKNSYKESSVYLKQRKVLVGWKGKNTIPMKLEEKTHAVI